MIAWRRFCHRQSGCKDNYHVKSVGSRMSHSTNGGLGKPSASDARQRHMAAIRGSYESQRWCAVAEAEEIDIGAERAPLPDLARLHRFVMSAFEGTIESVAYTISRKPPSTAAFAGVQTRLTECIRRIAALPSLHALRAKWPADTKTAFGGVSGTSALEVAMRLSESIDRAMNMTRDQVFVGGVAAIDRLLIHPVADPLLKRWRDAFIVELRTHLRRSGAKRQSIIAMRKAGMALVDRLGSEYRSARIALGEKPSPPNIDSLTLKISALARASGISSTPFHLYAQTRSLRDGQNALVAARDLLSARDAADKPRRDAGKPQPQEAISEGRLWCDYTNAVANEIRASAAKSIDVSLLKAIGDWKIAAAEEIDTIGNWRDANPELLASKFWTGNAYRPRVEPKPPKNFYTLTTYLFSRLVSHFPKLDPMPLQDIHASIAAWYEDRDARRLRPQPEIFATLERAMMTLQAVEAATEVSSKGIGFEPIADVPVPAVSPPKPRLSVDRERASVTLDEKAYGVTPDQAFAMQRLLEANGAWRNGRDLRSDPAGKSGRPDRVIARLPPPLRKLIQSEGPKGYRLVL